MKFLNILALAMFCFTSYGEGKLTLKIPETVEEAKTSLKVAEKDLEVAEAKHKEAERVWREFIQNLTQAHVEVKEAQEGKTQAEFEEARKKHQELGKQFREEVEPTYVQAKEVLADANRELKRAETNLRELEEQVASTEAKGPNKCATCDDEVSPLHTVQVERPENTNPEVAKETSGKVGSHGGSSGSR